MATPVGSAAQPQPVASPTGGAARLDVVGISKSFSGNPALQDLTLSAAEGSFTCLLGPSGSGKSTLLNLVAGFIRPDAGQVLVRGTDITDVPTRRRRMGVVFQNYALFPLMSVRKNVGYGLAVRGTGRDETDRRVDELLRLVHLEQSSRQLPAQLSGGEQQRVALARALAIRPDILLLDEPLSNLDAGLREELAGELVRIHQAMGTTTVMVTHDQREAFAIADQVAVLLGGRIQQMDTPARLYESPNSIPVARFVGHSNFVTGLFKDGDAPGISAGRRVLRAAGSSIPMKPGDAAALVIRPEGLEVLSPCDSECEHLRGQITTIIYRGAFNVVRIRVDGIQFEALTKGLPAGLAGGQTVCLDWDPHDAWILPPGPG
jgi:spermidine/putrescine transport system ATP-binding protein